MTRKLNHAWWGHLPAAVLLVGFVIYSSITAARWPARMPLTLGWHGEPSQWGSPWIAFGLVVGIGLVFLAISALADELWARQEGRKRFNAFALLDEVVIGWLVGAQGAMIAEMLHDVPAYHYPWGPALTCAAAAGLVAAILERLRPFVPVPDVPREASPEMFARAIAERVAHGERIVYWDVQNPRYVSVVSLGIPAVMWVAAGLSFGEEPWISAILALVGLPLLLFYGGMRTRVTREEVTVRYGLLGIRVFRCATKDIESIRLREFAALREFGGYGIRFAGSTVGYFLAGSQGVLIARPGKRSALIGSDHPGRLAAVLGAVSGVETTDLEDGKENG